MRFVYSHNWIENVIFVINGIWFISYYNDAARAGFFFSSSSSSSASHQRALSSSFE